MAQLVQNNIFVREWILQVKDSANQVLAIIGWIHAKKKKTQFEKNNTPRSKFKDEVFLYSLKFI